MTLPTPELDDRSFDELVEEALRVARLRGTGWTDFTTSDPGVVLIEAFAHLTEMMVYRMNRLPDKAYVALLELLGVTPHPAVAAVAELAFRIDPARSEDTQIPAGTEVSAVGTGDGNAPPVFRTLMPGTIPAGETEVRLSSTNALWTEGERVGVGTGLPGQTVTVRHRPMVDSNLPGQNLIVGVEVDPSDARSADVTIEHDGKAFAVWEEVPRFGPATAHRNVFCVNRFLGEIRFAPDHRIGGPDGALPDERTSLGNAPGRGLEIRLWYRHAGPDRGALAADRLNVLVAPVEGLTVTNPAPSIAGRPAEELENALARGPMELHALERAITARDFETLARRAAPGVNRARAVPEAGLWAHGTPGTVLVSLVPEPNQTAAAVTEDTLATAQQESVLAQIVAALSQRRAIGTTCRVAWARTKSVSVRADVSSYPGQNTASVEAGITKRLNALINPLDRGAGAPGWGFGRPLRAWDVLRAVGDLPGVAAISNIRLVVDAAPGADISTLARAPYQANTWYTASGPDLFRSGNNGDSWEVATSIAGERIVELAAYGPEAGDDPNRAGLLVAVTRSGDDWQLHLSRDCGETFTLISSFAFEVTKMAWIFRDRVPSVFIASPTGLFELLLRPGAAPRQVLVDPEEPEMGATDVAVSHDLQGRIVVAVAGTGERGVFLSGEAGQAGTFRRAGLQGELVRVLMVQQTATQRFLWAGVSAVGNDAGNGCYRAQLAGSGIDQDAWTNFGEGWAAGGCRALANDGRTIYAGSLRRGVLRLDPDAEDTAWHTPDVSCGLPLRDVGRLSPVDALAAGDGVVLAGGPMGVFRSDDTGVTYRSASSLEFENEVKLPVNWVFCAGPHEIRVTEADETL